MEDMPDQQFIVCSPVLQEKYLQDEILTEQQIGPDVARLVQINAIRPVPSGYVSINPPLRVQTFVLPTTVETFAAWLATITASPLLPSFFKRDMAHHEFPYSEGVYFVGRTPPQAAPTTEGYQRIAPNGGVWGWNMTDSEKRNHFSMEPLSFHLLPLDSNNTKIQMRYGNLVLADYAAAVLAKIAVRWPEVDLTSSTFPNNRPTTAATALLNPVLPNLMLTTDQWRDFDGTLRVAFPTLEDFRRLTRFGLNINLAEIVPDAKLSTVTLALLEWAEAQGRMSDLVTAACTANPTNPALQAFCRSITS